MRVFALQNFDNHRKGDQPDLPESYARALIKKGLAKAAPPLDNKMKSGQDNKTPSQAAGGQSSASRAARASRQTTAK